MLLPVLLIVAALLGLGDLLIVTTLADARVAHERRVETHLRSVAAGATATLRDTIATQVRRQADERIAYAPLDVTASEHTGDPQTTVTVTLDAESEDDRSRPSAACSTAQTSCNIETAVEFGEQRITATIRVAEREGRSEATLQRRVRLRVFRSAPYVVAADVRDGDDDTHATLGDFSGVAPEPGDAATPDPEHPERYRDTRIRVYAPCRQVPAGAAASPVDGKGWQDWQGDTPGPAHAEACDTSAGDVSSYVDRDAAVAPDTSGWRR